MKSSLKGMPTKINFMSMDVRLEKQNNQNVVVVNYSSQPSSIIRENINLNNQQFFHKKKTCNTQPPSNARQKNHQIVVANSEEISAQASKSQCSGSLPKIHQMKYQNDQKSLRKLPQLLSTKAQIYKFFNQYRAKQKSTPRIQRYLLPKISKLEGKISLSSHGPHLNSCCNSTINSPQKIKTKKGKQTLRQTCENSNVNQSQYSNKDHSNSLFSSYSHSCSQSFAKSEHQAPQSSNKILSKIAEYKAKCLRQCQNDKEMSLILPLQPKKKQYFFSNIPQEGDLQSQKSRIMSKISDSRHERQRKTCIQSSTNISSEQTRTDRMKFTKFKKMYNKSQLKDGKAEDDQQQSLGNVPTFLLNSSIHILKNMR